MRLHITGIASESVRKNVGRYLPVAFMLRKDLGSSGVGRARTGSSALLQLADGTDAGAIVEWLKARYPAGQAEVVAPPACG